MGAAGSAMGVGGWALGASAARGGAVGGPAVGAERGGVSVSGGRVEVRGW